jgi:hypothetical protein
MNGKDGAGREDQIRDRSLRISEAVGRYAFAQGIEAGLDQARDAIMRLLGEARAETHEAWGMLDAALAEEASPTEGTQQ